MPKYINRCKVITGPDTRWSYANVWEPRSFQGGKPKYSVCLIIPKTDTDTIGKIREAVRAAYEEGQYRLTGRDGSLPALKDLKLPIRDGDTDRTGDPAYAGCLYINANTARAPGIVDADCRPILDHSQVYSGVYGRASITMYAYNAGGNRGIACSLNNLQKIRDGEPLGTRIPAEADFQFDGDEDFLA